MKNSAQLIRSLNKSLENSRLTDSIKLCNDETNTRARIIHPFLEEPFFKTIFTLTSHEPNEFLGAYRFGDDLELNRFKSSMAYTDQALGDFVTFAKTQTWWENSSNYYCRPRASTYS